MSSTDFGPAFSPTGVGAEMFRANPQAQQFVAMISALYKAKTPLYDPDGAALEDPNAWSKVLKDGKFRSFISMRLAKVARKTWHLEPASNRPEDVNAATTLDAILREIPLFNASRRHFAKFAFWGRSHCWIEGRRDWKVLGVSATFTDGLLAEWWTPTMVRPLDKRQVVYQPETRKNAEGRDVVTVKTLLGTIDSGRHTEMQHPECLVTCVYDDEVERLGYGRGLLETLYHLYWVKGVVRRLGLQGLEKWANGIVVARIDANGRVAQDGSTESLAQSVLDSVMAMRSDGAIVLDKNDELEVVSQSGPGGELSLRWIDQCDEAAAQLCLGSIRPTGGGEGGSLARTEEESETTDDLLDNDREMIDEALTNTLVKLCWDLNAANLAALGLASAKMPKFRSFHVDREDPEKVGRTLKLAQELGMEIDAADAHQRMGIKRPAEDSTDVLKPAPAANPMGDFGAGGSPFGGPQDDAEGETGAVNDKPSSPNDKSFAQMTAFRRRLVAAWRALHGAA